MHGEVGEPSQACPEAVLRSGRCGQEAGGRRRRQEAGGRRPEAGGRRQEAGGVRQGQLVNTYKCNTFTCIERLCTFSSNHIKISIFKAKIK